MPAPRRCGVAPTFNSHDGLQISRRTRSSLRVPRGAFITSASESCTAAEALRFFCFHGHIYFVTTFQRTPCLRRSQCPKLLCFSTMVRMPPPIHCVRARLGVRHLSGQISEPFWSTDCDSTIVSLDILKLMFLS